MAEPDDPGGGAKPKILSQHEVRSIIVGMLPPETSRSKAKESWNAVMNVEITNNSGSLNNANTKNAKDKIEMFFQKKMRVHISFI